MNELIRNLGRPPGAPATTQAANGLPRRKWSSGEVQRMIDAGIIEHGERFELIGGELVAMASKGIRHERVKAELGYIWTRCAPHQIMVVQDTPLRLGPHDEPEPEIFVFPRGIRLEDVRGDTALLVVEVSKSSLMHDLTFKARLYASFGVRDYWVIDAEALEIHVLRGPDPAVATYATRTKHARTDPVTPLLVPELALRLADLGVE